MASSSSDTLSPGRELKELAERLFSTVHDRMELISIELQEEKYRLIQTFVWISTAVFVAMLAIAFASITLVYAFSEDRRVIVLGGLSGFYILAFIITVRAFCNYLARQPRPFADTINEFEKDHACFPDKN